MQEKKKNSKWEQLYTLIVIIGFVFTAGLMIVRCFYGTEITDEAYYVAEAKEILNGNIPFAFNNSSVAIGFTFFLVVFGRIYKFFVPDLVGIFLATRICFVIFKIVISVMIYLILRKGLKKADALLIASILIPTTQATSLQNFSYYSIPIWLFLFSSLLLYDAIEQKSPHKSLELFCAGFITGFGCFANPGWSLSVFVFLFLIMVREQEKKEKYRDIIIFIGAILIDVCAIIIPIISKTSFSEFWYGIDRLFFHKFPMEPLNPAKNLQSIISSFKEPLINRFYYLVVAIIIYYVFSSIINIKDKLLTKKQNIVFAFSIAFLLDIFISSCTNIGRDISSIWAFTALLYIIVFIFIGLYRNEKIIWYLGVYPVVFSIAEIILVSYDASIVRFLNCFTLIIPLLYILFRQESRFIRIVAILIASVLIIAIGYSDFKYVYRDDYFSSLKHIVKNGVYKGIYTSENRAADLPELEYYLNKIIGNNETYAFRDNVPCAYLMIHKGKSCDISTWDILQYTYKRNAPSVLFDYYRRRNMIPDKIIYIDYGRDNNLSIQDSKFRYNDWVNTYYTLTADFQLNKTFKHIMVYQYNGSFDGNYQYWIDSYYRLIK